MIYVDLNKCTFETAVGLILFQIITNSKGIETSFQEIEMRIDNGNLNIFKTFFYNNKIFCNDF
jgi:riboflavin synthase